MVFEAALPLTVAIPYLIGFIVLLAGSYTDFKTREVPDWVNFGLIGIGFGINLLFTIIYWKINFILASIVGFGIFFALAWLMFYLGQWGGGDSKMLMGLGALFGIDFLAKNFFLVHFLTNAMIVGALYGILWSIFLIFKNKRNFIKSFKSSMKNKKVMITKKIMLALFIILILVSAISSDNFIRLMLLYLAIVIVLTSYLWIAIKAVESSCMLKYVKPQQLTEGDWIAKEVKIDGKYITGPKDLGIEKSKIKKLVEFYKKGKVKKILIKEGIPFVPSFFIAYIITLMYGNLVFLLI
ncbi:prepilin peptidase [Candidatus Woesearchaeota archaeon]|nr:prepilin peptidase [Candidatus Woesearchaeota archaeon]